MLSPLALIPQYRVEHPSLILRCLSVLPKFTDFVGKPSLRDVKFYRSGDRPCLKLPGKLLPAAQHLQG
ncbi:hypothetical protein QUA70_21950 [Microcoleus sp. LAD1_D5]|uniref:hypothetical protein n=1 Tax=unclassified Microcoleus TaxID=2642155 RepID=UPI002FD43C39